MTYECLDLCITGYSSIHDSLVAKAAGRLHQAYRPKTSSAHMSHLRLFIQFSQYTASPFPPESPSSILAFMEFLHLNSISPPSISAYIHSLRSKFKALGLPVSHLYHHSISLALRSFHLNVPHRQRTKGIFQISNIQAITACASTLSLGYIYTPLFLLAFFAFLRLSNLVPVSPSAFSPRAHLCRGDIIFQENFATIIIKWSKTLQNQSKFATVQIPALGSSSICPYAHLKELFRRWPLPDNAPLFAVPQGQTFTILTQSQVRKTLASILQTLQIDPKSHPFHTFRRSGASLAFSNNVSLQAIQHHGTWTSDSVWNYIITSPTRQGSVVQSFRNLLHS